MLPQRLFKSVRASAALLPTEPNATATATHTSSPSRPSRKWPPMARPKVLLLDDDERVLRALSALLKPRFDVFATTNGAKAIDVLRSDFVHLVISDQRMPGLSGVEFLARAKEVAPDTARILLTGYADLDTIIGSINDGEVHKYLTKPWSNAEVLSISEEALNTATAAFARRAAAPSLTASSPADCARDGPAQDVREAASCPPCPVSKAAGTKDPLLVVDTEKHIRESLIELTQGKRPILLAKDYADAIVSLRDHPVKLAVCSMPRIDEADALFLRLIRVLHPELRLILAADSSDVSKLAALINQAKVFRYLPRPISTNKLRLAVTSALQFVDQEYPQKAFSLPIHE